MLLAGKIKYKYVCLTAYKQKNAEWVKRKGISEQETWAYPFCADKKWMVPPFIK